MKILKLGYVLIHKASKILDTDLEKLMSYIAEGHLDAFIKNPSELKIYGFTKKDKGGNLVTIFDNTGVNLMDMQTKNLKVIDKDAKRTVLSGYCLLKDFRRGGSDHIISNRLIVMSENGSEEGILGSPRYISLENVLVKEEDLKHHRDQIEEFDVNNLPENKRAIMSLDAQMSVEGLNKKERMHYLFEEGYSRLEIATHFELPLGTQMNKSKKMLSDCITTVRKRKGLEPRNRRVNKDQPLDRYTRKT